MRTDIVLELLQKYYVLFKDNMYIKLFLSN